MQRDRVVDLERGRNFRDVGGYAAAGDRRVRWGAVYRAGDPSGLTDGDLARLARLGIRSAVDLRGAEERSAAPSRLDLLPAIRAHWIPYVRLHAVEVAGHMVEHDRQGTLAEYLLTGGGGRGEAALRWAERRLVQSSVASYRDAMARNRDELRRVLELVARADVLPLVVHCNTGQHRTGLVCVALLGVLGVGRDDAVADFGLSNRLWAEASVSEYAATLRNVAAGRVSRLAPFFGVCEEAMTRVLEQLDAEPGGLPAALGISDRLVEDLRSTLLE
jgi:protein-tyrosine phosphatase